MIKSYYDITIKDVILLDATKSAGHLKKFWFIPIYFCRKELESLAKKIFESIGNSAVDQLQNDFDKLISYRNLQILEALYKLVIIELRLKSKIAIWKLIAGKDFAESEQLKEVLSEVLKYTGIDIKEPKDITDFNDYVEFKIDKYKEMFPEIKPDETEKANLTRIIYSIFNFMGESYNENMRLITFCEMKEIAEDRIRSQKPNEDGQ
ncbi:MAG TPA: hypothetical protein VIK55_06680 [Paludibacter sp.]